jgi:integrase
MLAMFLRLAWATGCRKSELQRLRWVDVDPIEHEQLGARLELRDTKNHEDRAVFVSKDLYRLLQAHEQEYAYRHRRWLFPSRTRTGRTTLTFHSVRLERVPI